MSLASRIDALATRAASEAKALRTLLNGNVASLSGLTTTAKTNLVAAINELVAGKANTSHTHTASQISDSTATGRSVLTAASTTAARTAIGAGTSSLALGTTAGTAAAGDHNHDAVYYTIAASKHNSVNIYSDGLRNYEGTSIPVPSDITVNWYHDNESPYMLARDVWFQKEDPAVPTAPDMAIIGSVVHNASALVTTRTLTIPAGVQAGDSIYLFISQPGGTSTTTPSGLTGLTLHKERKFSGNSAYVWQKAVAAGTESGTVVTLTSSSALYVTAALVVIRGTTGIIDSVYNDSLIAGTSAAPETPPLVITVPAFELQFLTRTGANIDNTPVVAPVVATKIAEAITSVDDGGASALVVARTSLAAQAAQSSLGGDIWGQGNSGYTAWTIALGAPA